MEIGYYFPMQKLNFNNEKKYQTKNKLFVSIKRINFSSKIKTELFYWPIIFNEYIEILGQN
jgi:hypothetical protein